MLLSELVSVIRFQNFEAFSVVPKFGSFIRRAASLHWIQLDLPFANFIGTISTLRLLLPIPHRSVSFAWRYRLSIALRFTRLQSSPSNLDFYCMGRPPMSSIGDIRFSQVPVHPSRLFAHVPSTPVGLLGTYHIATSSSVPTTGIMKTPSIEISELNSMAFRLAVYASSSRSPYPNARLAYDCLVKLYHVGLAPTGLLQEVSVYGFVSLPSSSYWLAWRKPVFFLSQSSSTAN